MRLAIVETAPYGGLLHYAVQLGDGLAERGHQVELLVPRDNELADHRGAAQMRPVLTPPVLDAGPAPAGGVRRLWRKAGVAARLASAWRDVVREARRGGYDVVVINPSAHISIAAVGLLGLTTLPHRFRIVHVAHNADVLNRFTVSGEWGRAAIVRAILRRAFARIDLVLVHGERSREQFLERWPTTRLAVMPHGDERLFGDPPPASNEQRILFFGDWNRAKGLPILMEAFDRLVADRPEARLTIAGTPYPRDVDVAEIEAWAAEHGDAVELIGRYIPLAEVPAVFARARVVATPYIAGYQSGVVHLAMTMGRAVVSSDVGDLPSAVRDGETGVVVPAGDVHALSAALDRVLGDPALAERFGRAARERVLTDSGWENVAAIAESALQSLFDPPASQAGSSLER